LSIIAFLILVQFVWGRPGRYI